MNERAYKVAPPWLRALAGLWLISLVGFMPAYVHGKELTPEQRKDFQIRMEKLRPLLDEYRQGKRDDADGHAIMHQMLQYYGILGSSTTVECQNLLKEWRSLLKKHPEFKINPPLEIREHREAREKYKKHSEEIAEKAKKPFVPKDSRPKIFWSGKRLAAVFQRRIEFYELPEGVECKESYKAPENIEPIQLHRHEGTGIDALRFWGPSGEVKLTPKSTITFGRWLEASNWTSHEAFAVTAFWKRYTASDQEEYEILRKLDDEKRPFTWENLSAAHQEFYGVVSVDGRILAEIPFKSTYPGPIMEALDVAPDGSVLFGVGKYVHFEEPGTEEYGDVFGEVSEVFTWNPEKGVQHLSAEQARGLFPSTKRWRQGLWAK